MTQVLAYPFLFVAIFFEAFVLVTFLSKDARQARGRLPAARDAHDLPRVAIIVPCWNESATLAATADSLLALSYPPEKLEIILVDNASTDRTPEIMARYANHAQIKTLREEKRGKHNAVNAGIAATTADIIGCLDADSFVDPAALLTMTPCFAEANVAAVTPAMSVHKPQNLLQHMQNAEYTFGITLKQAMAAVNGIHVTPGPFSLYRRAIVLALGGFRPGHQTEDLEMALRLQKAGYKIDNAPAARVYTKAPKSVFALVKQRTRWTSGFLRNVFNEYRGLIGSQKYGALGLVTLPVGLVMTAGGITLFSVALITFAKNAYAAVLLRTGMPLSYALSPHGHLDWFYLPSNLYLILGTATVVTTLAMIAIGKRISKTPGSLALGVLSYALFYGLVAPLWLIRASYDVATGTKRGWR